MKQQNLPMPVLKTRHDEIKALFWEYHVAHPKVWELFCIFTLERITRGFKHYSAKGIYERIRWETDQANHEGVAAFKLNNNYHALYARMFMDNYPQYRTFFRTRHLISNDKGATGLPELTPEYFDG